MASIRKKLETKKTKLAMPREHLDDHPAAIGTSEDGGFYQVEITRINPDPNQPRKFFDEQALEELAQSIRQKGVLQPVIIRRDETGNVHLVAGERRYRAAIMAGLERVPAVVTKGNPLEIALIENLQRENLKPVEAAEALGRMMEEYAYTHEQLAFVIGKARSTITETLSLNKLPEEIKEQCRRADNYPRRLLVEIAKKKDAGEMLELFNQVRSDGLKSDELRKITRKKANAHRRSPASLAFNKISSLTKHFKKLNLETLDETERAQLLTELQKLRQLINKFLD
jgi:ParB family transcriptional regulator, chromosome partitioning protein